MKMNTRILGSDSWYSWEGRLGVADGPELPQAPANEDKKHRHLPEAAVKGSLHLRIVYRIIYYGSFFSLEIVYDCFSMEVFLLSENCV